MNTDAIVDAAQDVCFLAAQCMRVERRRGELFQELGSLTQESDQLFARLRKAQDELNQLAKGAQS